MPPISLRSFVVVGPIVAGHDLVPMLDPSGRSATKNPSSGEAAPRRPEASGTLDPSAASSGGLTPPT